MAVVCCGLGDSRDISGRAALQQAHIHGELVAHRMDERRTETDAVAGRALLDAVLPNWRIALWALHLKRGIARPFLSACGAGDGHAAFSIAFALNCALIIAAATGGHTEFPHIRTWAVLVSGLPSNTGSIM